jgi:ribonuclease BN (tRNA processing enzyme)
VVGLSRAALEESLVIRMHKTVHPEYTVSYRFEERPTGKVMVVLTDHENTDSLPLDLRNHIRGADLLVQDAQYDRSQYEASRAGFGHGTGDYAARVMKETGAARLGHTHHDPSADDDQVEAIVAESRAWLRSNGAPAQAENVFACADYQEIEI